MSGSGWHVGGTHCGGHCFYQDCRPTTPLPSPCHSLAGIHLCPLVKFGERTRDCSLDQAGKEGPHLSLTGASCGFSRTAAPLWARTLGTAISERPDLRVTVCQALRSLITKGYEAGIPVGLGE